MALEIMGIEKIVILQNKIDLVSPEEAKANYEQIKEFIKGSKFENAPIIPISAQHRINIDESKLFSVAKIVESFSGIRIPGNKPIIGGFVFTQTSGIHADGDNKDNLYHNDLKPERFNRKHEYALGKLSGKASIKKNLEELGIELDIASMKKVTKRINELGDKKEVVTREDLPYIISDVLKSEQIEQKIKIKNYALSVAAGLQSVATLSIEIDRKTYEETASGDGQYDAFMNALWRIYDKLGKPYPELIDYNVTIPPGGRTDALCHTTITWKLNNKQFKTNGLDSDQAIAAIKATIKMLNVIELSEHDKIASSEEPEK